MKLSILLTLIIVVVLMLGALRPVCVALNNDEFAHFNVPPHSSMLPTMIQPAALLLGWGRVPDYSRIRGQSGVAPDELSYRRCKSSLHARRVRFQLCGG